ncbi:MAG TPA: hypothetical protein VHU43_06185 [Steroidobacteraceae bacterium]|nr:hypothetical protein [Steroidobacteraceae bacterium]
MTSVVAAAPAPFDLAGPTLEVKVTRGGNTLPASQVPNLAPGDRIWIKADLPETQSVEYLMVAAFLSGSTNPPPEKWFFACKIWTAKCGSEGLTVTVPQGAQQVLLFLAPHTGGDLRTVVGAVRGRPGAFVRTSQDLNQAALDRSRLERFLAAVHVLNEGDPAKLKHAAPLLARSLAIKVDEKCLDRIAELQASCLMQGQESLILNDGHSTSIVEALTSGPGSDLAMEASYTPQLSYGYYSPYIASVLDVARIFESFRTAQYQYIPALASQRGDKLALTLNAAPSFHSPRSVLVIALPAVESAQLPPLHAVDPKEIFCVRRSSLVLPVDGAPLAFSTGYAHDLTLNVTGRDGKTIALPTKADPIQGGYVVDTTGLGTAELGDSVHAALKGYWGFEPYEGPTFHLINVHAKSWELAAGDEAALIVGRQDTVHLQADSVSCVDAIMLKDPGGKELKVDWKSTRPDEVEIKLPLQEATPGAMTLLVKQFGNAQPDPIAIHTFADAGRIDGFSIHAGDIVGMLKGNRLDEVASLSFKGNVFVPGELTSTHGVDELPMVAQDPPTVTGLKPERGIAAKVTLKDGRVFPSIGNIDAPRPAVTLLGMNVQPSASSHDSNILLAHPSELPQDAVLTFSLRTQSPAVFARDENIEVTTGDESSSATLNFGNGGVMLENSQVAVATLNPAKVFGGAAFGPLQFRINFKGVVGDWQPLANLVRLPMLKELKCPATPELACKLSGSNLFLIDSISDDRDFAHPVKVPDGFLGSALPVPHPKGGALFVKLRDDPSVINTTSVVAQEVPPSADEAARTEVRGSAVPAPAHPDTGAAHPDTGAAHPDTGAVPMP